MREVRVGETWLRRLFQEGTEIHFPDGHKVRVEKGLKEGDEVRLAGMTHILGTQEVRFLFAPDKAWRAQDVVMLRTLEEAVPGDEDATQRR